MRVKSILLAGLPAVAALCVAASAQAGTTARPPSVQLPKSPVSASTLLIRGLKAGTIHMSPAWAHDAKVGPGLNCTGKPCALPNVEGSAGATQSVDETPIAVNPLNSKQLITGGNDYNCTATSYRGFWTSNNGGKSWAGACGKDVAGSTGEGDPIVGYDLVGDVFQGGIDTKGISVASSQDNGKTWNAPVVVTFVSGYSPDKPWLEVDQVSPNKNTLYVSSTQFASNSNSVIYVAHSTDNGKTWTSVAVSPTGVFPNVNQFSDLAVDSSGNVYVSYLNCTANGKAGDCGGTSSKMYVQKSSDGGVTWSSQVAADTVTLAPDSCFCGFYGSLPNTDERVSDIPVIAADTSGGVRNGQLYLVDYSWTGTYMQVRVTSSTDGGNTWSTPVPVAGNSQTHDQFFPWINVDNAGHPGVTWLDRRDDPNNINYEAFATWSSSGGATFKANTLIADTPSDPFHDGFGGGFMGDYTGNGWFGKKLFASWTDTRNGSYSQDEVGGLKR